VGGRSIVVDQRVLQVEREDFDAHPSEASVANGVALVRGPLGAFDSKLPKCGPSREATLFGPYSCAWSATANGSPCVPLRPAAANSENTSAAMAKTAGP
jgi:hypothetical protein